MNLIEQGRRRLEAPHRALAKALLRQPVAGADETGARVEGRLHWLHVLASESLSWLSVHPKRGLLAFEELGVLPRFRNILVHDGLKSHKKLKCDGLVKSQRHQLLEKIGCSEHRVLKGTRVSNWFDDP